MVLKLFGFRSICIPDVAERRQPRREPMDGRRPRGRNKEGSIVVERKSDILVALKVALLFKLQNGVFVLLNVAFRITCLQWPNECI